MSTFKYRAGIGQVGSYQVSGLPYITGSASLANGLEQKVEFPRVAKTVLVINDSAQDIRVHFNATGSGNVVGGKHFVTLTSNRDSISMGIRCKEIYVSNPGPSAAAFTVFAELTGIEAREMNLLTGSGLTE
jgi:hypothetical protein